MEYCPHCIKEVESEYCPYCGGLVNWTASVGQLPVGTVLSRQDGYSYQLGAAKGQGGFGITYAGMDLQNGRRVAVKEYYPSRCASRTETNLVHPITENNEEYRNGMRSFLEEALMLSAVGALPSVVTVYDCFEANGTAYLVMEYVDGSPLHSIVSKNGHFTATELLPLLPELLNDLGILHKAGIIHRDISPDNLILTPDGKLKLLDFGSARSLSSSKNMTVLLKPGFSPVEQYQSSGQGPYTDLYALASTVYFCLTGVIPPASFDRLSNDTLQRPNTFGAGLTATQEEVIMWALSVKAEERPQSAEQLSQKLFGGGVVVSNHNELPPVSQSQYTVTDAVTPIFKKCGSFIEKYVDFFYMLAYKIIKWAVGDKEPCINPKNEVLAKKISVYGSMIILAILALAIIIICGSVYWGDWGVILIFVFVVIVSSFLLTLAVNAISYMIGHRK